MKSRLLYNGFNKVFFSTYGYDDYLERFEDEGFEYALHLQRFLKPKMSWRFLDVGCGMGGIVLALRNLNFKAFGTEVSPFCLKNSPARQWMKFGEICNLPFHNLSFDVSICIEVTIYLKKQEIKKAIKELARITKKYIYFETICKGSLNSSQKFNPDPLRKTEDLLTSSEIKDLFEKEGFQTLSPMIKDEDFNFVFKRELRKKTINF